MTARTGATAAATPDPRAAVPVHGGVLALGTLRANKRLQSDGAQRPLVPRSRYAPRLKRGVIQTLRIDCVTGRMAA
jgi:hypothetical protein